MSKRYYPDSKVEIQGFMAKFYDNIMNIGTFGKYKKFIEKAIGLMAINENDKILDLGAGTGRNALLMKNYLSDKGEVIGLEISDLMIKQFKEKTKDIPNINVVNKRIDQPLNMDKAFDKVFISFVFHGFPFEVQKRIIQNAYNSLKENGEFILLDFSEFTLDETSFYFRIPFKFIECKYAFEYVERDWEKIFLDFNFEKIREDFFIMNKVRLLKLRKISK